MRSPYDWIGRFGVVLAIVGTLTWSLIGLVEWNLVAALLGDSATVSATLAERIVYVLVGLGGVIAIPMISGSLRRSESGSNVRSIRSTESPVNQRKAA
jgi:uncharacterized membrane protein YuzA (DUF378 family)